MEKIKVIRLPFPMPTWNRILAMGFRDRAKLRNWIHRAVFICIQEENDSLTRTELVAKLQLMGLYMPDYLLMIRPNLSKALAIRKRKSKRVKWKKR